MLLVSNVLTSVDENRQKEKCFCKNIRQFGTKRKNAFAKTIQKLEPKGKMKMQKVKFLLELLGV